MASCTSFGIFQFPVPCCWVASQRWTEHTMWFLPQKVMHLHQAIKWIIKWENWWSTIGFGFGPWFGLLSNNPAHVGVYYTNSYPCLRLGWKNAETPTPHRPTPTRRAFALLWWHIPCCRPWANHHRPATSQGSTLRALALDDPGMDHQDASTFHGQGLFLHTLWLAFEPSIRLKSPLRSSPRTELGVCGTWMALAQQQLR